MAIINRTLDPSEEKKAIMFENKVVATGATFIATMIPYPGTICAITAAGYGVSNAPTIALTVNRFITGTGFTAISLVAAQTYQAYATSGIIAAGLSLPASGSTLLNVMANDIIVAVSGGSNSAVTSVVGTIVMQPTQDIKQFLNGLA